VTRDIVSGQGAGLPPDIAVMRRRLLEVQETVGSFKRRADGLLFGVIGLDALIGLVPVAGGLYSSYGGLYLLQQAIKAKCSLGTILMGCLLVMADVVIGVFVGAGDIADVVLRTHAWFGGMILDEVDTKLGHIDRHAHAAMAGAIQGDTELRDQLYRGGKSQSVVYIRLGIVAAICMFLLHECRRAEEARQESIRACEARGGWFCSWRL
jgi:hypothetical protein